MSSAQDGNIAFNLVRNKISRLITRWAKLKEGDPAAKSLSRDIAVAFTTALSQHGHAATSFTPMLLSCAAKIQDKSGPDGRLKGVPDWSSVSDDNPRIQGHPLFHKTVGYIYPASAQMPAAASTTAPAVAPSPCPPMPATSMPEVIPTLSQLSSPTPSPSPSPIIKHKLFVPGTKHKALTPSPQPKPELEVVDVPEPLPKKRKMAGHAREASRVPANGHKSVKAKSKEFVGDNADSNLQDKVIHICAEGMFFFHFHFNLISPLLNIADLTLQKTPKVGISAQQPAWSPSVESASLMSGDLHPVCLFAVQCERCIKDDTPCTMILAKKTGKIRKCCLNCDVKKTKCTRPSAEEQQALWAAIALKKAKASAAEKRVQNSTRAKTTPPQGKSRPWSTAPVSTQATRATSCVRPAAPTSTEDEDAQGEADPEPGRWLAPAARPDTSTEDDPAPAPASAHPPKVAASMPAVDNDVNMDFTAGDDLPPCLEPSDTRQDTIPVPPVQPPTQLDIIPKSIEALGTRVTALDKEWAQKFTVMEQRMRDIEIQTNTNTVSIGHMDPFINNPNTGKPFIPPPAEPVHGHPYGPMPLNWLSRLPPITGTGEQVDPSISLFSKQYTTLWNPSQGPQEAGLRQASVSAVHHSSGASASMVRTSGDSTP
ncbi:hypothetical protein EDB19DRAFT_1912746 [Suillus lakei]|nr:hypothetical protein EDB19DRAFT_1912746 [Suillus lakei]